MNTLFPSASDRLAAKCFAVGDKLKAESTLRRSIISDYITDNDLCIQCCGRGWTAAVYNDGEIRDMLVTEYSPCLACDATGNVHRFGSRAEVRTTYFHEGETPPPIRDVFAEVPATPEQQDLEVELTLLGELSQEILSREYDPTGHEVRLVKAKRANPRLGQKGHPAGTVGRVFWCGWSSGGGWSTTRRIGVELADGGRFFTAIESAELVDA